MKKFLSIYRDNLEDFIHTNLTSRPSNLFNRVEAYALETRVPILSPATGEVLQFIIRSRNPTRILELGTGLGYSILWMLSTGLPLSIESWERNPECLKKAGEFVNQFLSENQNVNLKQCHILDTISTQTFLEYDLIFIDCDKVCYPELIRILPGKMRKGATLLFDNVLWHGRLHKEIHTRPSDISVQNFWETILQFHSKRTLFPVGDGLLLVEVD